jgi:hypothetical protein
MSKIKIKEVSGLANGFPEKLMILDGERERLYRQDDDVYYLCYQFCEWLETRPRGSVGGATNLLRAFLQEKGYVKE